eukprot:12454735-Alexandrium_andersonii.AAC.1
MAETPRREASPPPQKPFRTLSRPPPGGRRTMGDGALAGQLGAPPSRRPKLPREKIFALNTVPFRTWPREGSEGPLGLSLIHI